MSHIAMEHRNEFDQRMEPVECCLLLNLVDGPLNERQPANNT